MHNSYILRGDTCFLPYLKIFDFFSMCNSYILNGNSLKLSILVCCHMEIHCICILFCQVDRYSFYRVFVILECIIKDRSCLRRETPHFKSVFYCVSLMYVKKNSLPLELLITYPKDKEFEGRYVFASKAGFSPDFIRFR